MEEKYSIKVNHLKLLLTILFPKIDLATVFYEKEASLNELFQISTKM